MLKVVLVSLFLLSPQVFAALGMDPVPRNLLTDKSTVIEVGSMPRVRSQDTFGICYAFVAATMLDQANCAAKKTLDCASVPDSEKMSPLDMARYGAPTTGTGIRALERFNFDGLSEGGSTVMAMFNALASRDIVKESCAPFDQVIAKAQSPLEAQKLEQAMWKKFKDSYDSYKKKAKECSDCGLEYATAKTNEIKENYNLKAPNEEILKAFAEETYGKFLDRLLVPDECWSDRNSIQVKGKWDVKQYPQKGQKKSDYSSTVSKIKDLLTKKRPISLDFCAQEKVTVKSRNECGNLKNSDGSDAGANHAVVIKGYRKVCRSANDCYEALQIQNSWGESWQNANSDGWVDAKVLLDRSFYDPGALTWLEEQQEVLCSFGATWLEPGFA